MTSSKPDDLFYKTLITEAWTSDVVFVILLGLVGWLFICLFLDAYLILNIFLTWVGFVIAFVGATTIIILTKWPAIHVYRSGKEYQVDKIRDKVGARAISQREMHKLEPVLERMAQLQPNAKGFDHIFILDMPAIGAFTIGNSIFSTAQTLESPHLGALFAHEIGHIQHEDGTVMLALRTLFQLNLLHQDRLVNPLEFSTGTLIGESVNREELMEFVDPAGIIKDMKTSLLILGVWNLFAASGFGVRVHMKAWSDYFREQDYLADDFAVKCGYGRELADYLEEYKYLYSSNELAWQSAPELRIDRILAAR